VTDLAAARAKRWWHGKPQVRTPARAAAFVADMGFAVLFTKKSAVSVPCLWEVARDDPPSGDQWGPDIQRVWAWKDELPKSGRAWYGDFVAGQKSFVAPNLLALLYPRAGTPDDWRTGEWSAGARAIAEVLEASGPTPSSVLREAAGFAGPGGRAPFTRALAELGRGLAVTHLGVEAEGPGWPSAVIDLTARAFAVRAIGAADDRRRAAALRFLDTMVEATPAELARIFGWRRIEAQTALRELVESGEARVVDGRFAPVRR